MKGQDFLRNCGIMWSHLIISLLLLHFLLWLILMPSLGLNFLLFSSLQIVILLRLSARALSGFLCPLSKATLWILLLQLRYPPFSSSWLAHAVGSFQQLWTRRPTALSGGVGIFGSSAWWLSITCSHICCGAMILGVGECQTSGRLTSEWVIIDSALWD